MGELNLLVLILVYILIAGLVTWVINLFPDPPVTENIKRIGQIFVLIALIIMLTRLVL